MTTYRLVIEIDTTNRPDRLQHTAERMVRDWFGSSAQVTNLLEVADHPITHTCNCERCQAWYDAHDRYTTSIHEHDEC